MSDIGWDPPNTGYRSDPITGVPLDSQADLAKLPDDLVCRCGGKLTRIGSVGPYGTEVRCIQCGAQGGLLGPYTRVLGGF